jgi:electron transfer flavoprotein beta subunit
VKYVPDATGDRHFADDLTVDRDDVDGLLSELDEYAVEQALQISENSDDDVEVTVLTVGPEDAKDALRKALSMGADKAIHVEDDDLRPVSTWSSPVWPPPTAPWAWSRRCWPSGWVCRR